MLTSPLRFDSLYCELIQKYPNLPKFRVFGYLCYLSLWPYNSHKLEPRSRPCIFLGNSLVRDTYHAIIRCYNPELHNIFTSQHVVFKENELQFLKLNSTIPNVTTNLCEKMARSFLQDYSRLFKIYIMNHQLTSITTLICRPFCRVKSYKEILPHVISLGTWQGWQARKRMFF